MGWNEGNAMSELLNLELPDDLARRARALAAASHKPFEDAVVDWIGRAVAEFDVESLPDAELLALADSTWDDALQSDLSDLLARNRDGDLNDPDRVRLDRLMAEYRQGLVRKARALREAVSRGLRPSLSDDAA